MIGANDRIAWGGEGASLYGVITSKKVGNAGRIAEGLDSRGSARQLAVRDQHKTVNLTATACEGVTEDNIPLVGEPFRVPVNGRELVFHCTASSLETFPEEASVLTLSGRTLGETPVGQPFITKGN